MTDHPIPTPAPADLGPAGARLWSSVVDSYDLDVHEELLLLQAARCADRLDQLTVAAGTEPTLVTTKGDVAPHPALVEFRAQALVLARLFASLRLPTGETADGGLKRPQRRGAARGTYGLRRSA